jgi:hypothetical protein
MTEERLVVLPDQWTNTVALERALQHAWRGTRSPFSKDTAVIFSFPPSCKVMVDVAVRLLSLANQLAAAGIPVTFAFEARQHEAMSYLNRAYFFPLLSERVQVLPERPDPAHALQYQGQSSRLIEFKPLHPRYSEAVRTVPSQLADALETALALYPGGQEFGQTPYTLFTELINNVYDHSQTELDGFAALQVYRKRVQVVVSDSGVGLLETLRPKLRSPEAQALEEAELLRRFLRNELAWDDRKKGQGLQACAQRSLKHWGSVDIRLETSRIFFSPSPAGYEKTNMQYFRGLVPLRGTHISFSFPLDKPG